MREIPPPPRRPDIIKPCGPIFFPFNSARINNEHKACLDDIAITLQQDSRQTLVIDGHRDSSERAGISLTRANNARDYLVDSKNIDSARITIRNFSDTCPHENGDAKLNSRVEFWVVPEGAAISDINAVKRCANGITPRVVTGEQPASPTERRPARRTRRPEPSADFEEPEDEQDRNDERVVSTSNGARPETGSFGAATIIRSVSTRMINGALHVYVETDGIAQFKDFTLATPSRIVVDILGVRSASGSKTLPGVSGLVDRVRVGEPQPNVVRIVLDLKSALRYRVMRDGSSLVIIISEGPIAAGAND